MGWAKNVARRMGHNFPFKAGSRVGTIVFIVIVYTVLVVLPFKLAAGWLGADRSDWLSCFAAVLVAGILGGGLSGVLGGGLTLAFFGASQGLLSLALVAVISGLTNRFVLGTTFVRGVLITVIGALVIPAVFIAAFVMATRNFA